VIQLVQRGRITADSIIRGPLTRQFWVQARNVPSVANLLGECHACHASVEPTDAGCPRCGASFAPVTDREYLGLSPVHLLPGSAPPEVIAKASGLAAASLRRPPTTARPPLLALSEAGPGVPTGAVPALGGYAPSPLPVEASLRRLRQRSRQLTVVVWALAIAAAALAGLLAITWGGRPGSAAAPSRPNQPAVSPAAPAPSSPSAAKPHQDASSTPPTISHPTATPPEPATSPTPDEHPAAPDPSGEPSGSRSHSGSALLSDVERLIATDTDESLAQALAAISSHAAGGAAPTESDETAAAASSYIQKRITIKALQRRL
jgi:hypothetical protein